MHKELKEKAIRLRLEDQLSYNAIRAQVPVAKSTLSSWLKQFPLSQERVTELKRAAWSKVEAKIEAYRNTMRRKKEVKEREVYEKYLRIFGDLPGQVMLTSGLVLYLAEGGKTSYYNVTLANTDPTIIKFFVQWLCVFFKIPKSKLRAHLHLYENMDTEKERRFWKNELGFEDYQFYKPYITRYKRSSFLYKESFRHGTCSIYLSGLEYKRELMMAIKALFDKMIRPSLGSLGRVAQW